MSANNPTSLASAVGQLFSLLLHRQFHKAGGTALAIVGLANGITTPNGWKEVTLGAGYTSLMHIVGGIKKLPD